MAENQPTPAAAVQHNNTPNHAPGALLEQRLAMAATLQLQEKTSWNVPDVPADDALPEVSPTHEAPQEMTTVTETNAEASQFNSTAVDETCIPPHHLKDDKVLAEANDSPQQRNDAKEDGVEDRIISDAAHLTPMDPPMEHRNSDPSPATAPQNASRSKIAPGLEENPIHLDDDEGDDDDDDGGTIEVLERPPAVWEEEDHPPAAPVAVNGVAKKPATITFESILPETANVPATNKVPIKTPVVTNRETLTLPPIKDHDVLTTVARVAQVTQPLKQKAPQVEITARERRESTMRESLALELRAQQETSKRAAEKLIEEAQLFMKEKPWEKGEREVRTIRKDPQLSQKEKQPPPKGSLELEIVERQRTIRPNTANVSAVNKVPTKIPVVTRETLILPQIKEHAGLKTVAQVAQVTQPFKEKAQQVEMTFQERRESTMRKILNLKQKEPEKTPTPFNKLIEGAQRTLVEKLQREHQEEASKRSAEKLKEKQQQQRFIEWQRGEIRTMGLEGNPLDRTKAAEHLQQQQLELLRQHQQKRMLYQQQQEQRASQHVLQAMQQYQYKHQSLQPANQHGSLQTQANSHQVHGTSTFRHLFAQLPTDKNLSPDVYFVQFLEVFTFGRRPRSNGFDPDLTPTARAFQRVYNSEERQILPVIIGICCLACKRRSMERRQHWCAPSGVQFPSSQLTFYESLVQLRLHMSSCDHASQRDKALLSRLDTLPTSSNKMSLSAFSFWYCKTFGLFSTVAAAQPRKSNAVARDARERAQREAEAAKDEMYQDLQDAVAGGSEKGRQRYTAYTFLSSLIDIPFSSQYPDTTLGLLLLDSFELVMIRGNFADEAPNSKQNAVVQCKYCHRRNADGSRNPGAYAAVLRNAEGAVDVELLTKDLVGLFYSHLTSCHCAPKEVGRKVIAMRLVPRSERFNMFARNIHQRCLDAAAILNKDSSKRLEPKKDRELWVSPSLQELGKIMQKSGGNIFTEVTEAVVGERGSMVQNIEEFPRIGILHGGVSSAASTKNDLSKRKRTPWSDTSSKVVCEEDLPVCDLAKLAWIMSNKKAKVPSTCEKNARVGEAASATKVNGEEDLRPTNLFPKS